MLTDEILKTRIEIKRFFIAGFWTLLLETLICLYIAYLSKSLTIFTFMLQNSLSLIIYFFAIVALIPGNYIVSLFAGNKILSSVKLTIQ